MAVSMGMFVTTASNPTNTLPGFLIHSPAIDSAAFLPCISSMVAFWILGLTRFVFKGPWNASSVGFRHAPALKSDWACCDVVFQTVLNALVSAGVLKTRAVGGDLGACAGM